MHVKQKQKGHDVLGRQVPRSARIDKCKAEYQEREEKEAAELKKRSEDEGARDGEAVAALGGGLYRPCVCYSLTRDASKCL